ncbi:OmpH family outer membrane protein [Citrobacter freundii]|uniref:OmpH family outer membrane protein n=2 Tax=Citrobacter TaxID=544 RepID=UPI00115F2A2E|nr:OmpH family outer membrane protein [Citrobacter freundii]EJD6092820.1 OmpH family outer membrane protein [Citrobacter freundii]EKS9217691.1 OmpH family outer membrane protein [Citrobacter freundii]MBJ8813437.1 OmpH family outer membrane protein [Citrobacter freundii]QLN71784.1 OmpH family outer membrane protein [Citrobacter freundii]QMI76737.1 OmpH family outer membrane protein [Citrobacter freundii]
MLELNVSKISNVITFNVDKASMAEAKKAAADLQKYFAKLQDPKIRFKTFKQNQRRAEALSDDAKLKNAVKSSESKQQRIADKAAKTQAREQAKIAKRNETADIKFKSAGLQLRGIAGKYGVDPAKQYEALKFIQEQTEQFRKGVISSQRMNFTIRERITDLRREAALQARITASTQQQAIAQRQAKRTDYKGAAAGIKEKGLNVIGGGAGFIGATAALAGGAGILSRIRDKGNENLELVRMSERTKLNPNAVKAIVAWGQQHGVDSASVDKITDGFGKDTREKISETLMNSQFDQKSGKWKGGNSNIEEILNKFGWNKSQLSQYEDNPLDFLQASVNEGQRRGYSDGELSHLLENIFDDGAHYLDLFKNNGEQFISTLKKLVDSGQTLDDEQIKQAYAYGDLSVAMGNLVNGVDNSLFTGFMKGFADGGDELVKNTQVITESAGMLGEGLGDLAKQVTGFVGEISGVVSDLNEGLRSRFPQWFTNSDKPAAQALYDGAVGGSANATADWIQDKTGFNTRSVGPAIMDWLGVGGGNAGTAANQYSLNGDSLRGSAMSLSSGNAPVYTVNPTFNLNLEASVPLTIASDSSRLSDYIDFQARASQASFAQSLTLQMSSGQSSTGG